MSKSTGSAIPNAMTMLDPELAAALAAFPAMPDPSSPDWLQQFRFATDTVAAATATNEMLERAGTYAIHEFDVPGPPDHPSINVLMLYPTSAKAAVPALYHVHGGGMVAGDARAAVGLVQDLVGDLDIAIVGVNYRLAPEHPGPAGVEDTHSAMCWIAEHADELGIDPEKIIIIGASGGGGIAAGATLLARDRGGPALLGQILMCPMLDDRNDTSSNFQFAGQNVWDRKCNEIAWRSVLGEHSGGPDVSSYVAPARATDLSGLPPALIDVGAVEIFRDEVIAYSDRIWRCGGNAELHVWPGAFHGFDFAAPHSALAQSARRTREEWLTRIVNI